MTWVSNSFSLQTRLPFSLKLGGKDLSKLQSRFILQQTEPQSENDMTTFQYVYSDSISGLELKITFKVMSLFQAVDMVLQITNKQSRKSPVLENIQVFDSLLHPFLPTGSEVILHHSKGSCASKDDFQPIDDLLVNGKEVIFSPVGGRSSNTTIFPFFNLETKSIGGVVIAVGWSGQWASTILQDMQGQTHFKLGMQRTRIVLEAGESVRMPRVLFFPWRDSKAIAGHNAFRRFFLQYYAPRRNRNLVQLPLACYGVRDWAKRNDEANFFTEANQKEFADAMAPFGPEVFWIDAGWFEGRWPNGVGSG